MKSPPGNGWRKVLVLNVQVNLQQQSLREVMYVKMNLQWNSPRKVNANEVRSPRHSLRVVNANQVKSPLGNGWRKVYILTMRSECNL